MEPLGGDDNNDDMNEGASTSNALDISPGTLHGIEHAKKLGKDENQLLFINLAKEDEILDSSEEVHKVVQWLIERNIYKCAIGGPRESEVKGIELKAFHFLKKVFEQYKKENTKQGKTSRAC